MSEKDDHKVAIASITTDDNIPIILLGLPDQVLRDLKAGNFYIDLVPFGMPFRIVINRGDTHEACAKMFDEIITKLNGVIVKANEFIDSMDLGKLH